MGNRITDIGKMRSRIDRENRKQPFGVHKTARLGSPMNPANVSVQSEDRFNEVTSIFEEHGWKYRIVLEEEKPEEVNDLSHLLNPLKPQIAEKKVGRNQPCPCGSGKKSKSCGSH